MTGEVSGRTARCSNCDRRSSPKKLHDLGAGGLLCRRCYDNVAPGLRRTLIRRAQEAVR